MESWISCDRISKENNYNILRIIGAVAVIYGHMYILMGGAAPVLYANEISALGFKMLMVLSGYMVTQSCIYDSKITHYIVKRSFRIIPALFFYTVIAICVIGPLFTTVPLKEYFAHEITWKYFYNVLLIPHFQLPAVFASNPYPYAVNGSLWGLPVEVSCYIIVYFVLVILCKIKWRKAAFSVFTAGICILRLCAIQFFPEKSFVLLGTDWFRALALFPYFFIGALFAVTEIKKLCSIQIAFVLFMLSVAFRSNVYVVNELLAMLIIPYMVISIGECSKPKFSTWFRHTDITYGLFLWGFAVQQILIQIIVVNKQIIPNVNVMFVLSLFVSIILAFITWFCIEKPAAGLMRIILNKL